MTLPLRPPQGLGWGWVSPLGLGAGRRPSPPLHRPLRLQQSPSPPSPPQAPRNCFPMLLMMPKPWVGGGWVRADQGSQGRKAAQARDSLIQPSYRKDGEGGGSDPPREYNVLRESWGPPTPPPLLDLECRFQARATPQRPDRRNWGSRTQRQVHSHFSGCPSW